MFLKTRLRQKIQIIVNPESNKGRTGKRWKNIKESLHTFLKEFKYEFTEKPLHATEISRAAIKEGTELIVGVGGDGTMHEIANGFFENQMIINPETVLGVLPSGTGSDLSKSLNIPPGIKNALEIIKNAPNCLIDAGRVSFKSPSSENRERFFLNIADFGIGGEVVRRVNLNRMKRKTSSYLQCLIATFINYKNKKLKLKIDGKELPSDEYMIGAIANGKIFGKGMKIAPDACLDDGFFDIVLISGMSMLEFCLNAWRIYSGSHLKHSKISLTRGKKVEIEPIEGEDALIEVDGELLCSAPATFEITPRIFPIKAYL
jgi:YegS/Rv2252/BmrU family lipid kinase